MIVELRRRDLRFGAGPGVEHDDRRMAAGIGVLHSARVRDSVPVVEQGPGRRAGRAGCPSGRVLAGQTKELAQRMAAAPDDTDRPALALLSETAFREEDTAHGIAAGRARQP
jgi:hypothetical protein